jgi:hypothetical protein
MSDSITQPSLPMNSDDPGGASQGLPGAAGGGEVITIAPGSGNTTIEGGNKNFVVEYTGSSADAGNNTLTVTGGNNNFVIKYDFAPTDGSAPSNDGSNVVHVEGGNNTFAVVYEYGAAADPSTGAVPANDTSNVVASGLGGSIVTNAATNDTTNGNLVEVGGGNTVSASGGNNSFVVANSFPTASGPSGDGTNNGGNSVSIDGANNTFVVAYDYGASGLTGAGTYDFSGLPAPTAATPSTPTTSSAGTTSMSDTTTAASGAGAPASAASSGRSDLSSQLRQSPFGRLLDLPGVTPATLFGNLPSSGSGANPFGDSASLGSNPFTNYPGSNSIFSAATNAGSGFAGAAPEGAGSAPATTAGGSDPASMPADLASNSSGVDPSMAASAGDAFSASGGGMPDAASLLAQSPFAPLLSLPGVTADNLFSAAPISASDAAFFQSVFGGGSGSGGAASGMNFLAANGVDTSAVPSGSSGSAPVDPNAAASAASSAASAAGVPSSLLDSLASGSTPNAADMATMFAQFGSGSGAAGPIDLSSLTSAGAPAAITQMLQQASSMLNQLVPASQA